MSGPTPQFDVVAIGSWTNFDHLLEVTSLPAPGDTVQISSPVDEVERVYFGGCAPNVAVGAARLGARAALVSVVGDDFRTRGYSAWLDERGVDQRAVQLIAGERCGHSFLFRDAGGNSVCISQLGFAARQEEFAPDAATTAAGKVAVITCRFDRFTLRAAELARAGGARVILSGALATAPGLAAAFITTSDILVCTEHELTQLISLLVCDEACALLEMGLSAIVRTRGAAGASWQTAGASAPQPGHRPTPHRRPHRRRRWLRCGSGGRSGAGASLASSHPTRGQRRQFCCGSRWLSNELADYARGDGAPGDSINRGSIRLVFEIEHLRNAAGINSWRRFTASNRP